MAGFIFSKDLVDSLRRTPMHEVLRDLGASARDVHLLESPEFRKLVGYLTEVADGRDRREPMTDVPGPHRPAPRLRVLINHAFGEYGDLTWFRLNKIANNSRLPLTGCFPRMAASVGRLGEEDLAELVAALVSDAPDKKLLKLLNERGGRIRNCGLELFTRLAYLFRPDLYFLIPKTWGEQSGCLKFINDDLRKYCAVCRTLRTICDEVGFPPDVRATLFDRAVQMDPMHPTLESAITRLIGGALAWANVLDPNEAYTPGVTGEDQIAMPLEVASQAIRVRRGDGRLRAQLIRMYRGECAIAGKTPKDLLEVAYIAPYPAGDVHSLRNAILLRADLHTLWDLNLIGVEPETMQVHIAQPLAGSFYEMFDGVKLSGRSDGAGFDRIALKERWSHFKANAKKKGKSTSASASDAGAAAAESTPAEGKAKPTPEIEVLGELTPKKSSGASGIWRSPSTPASPSAPGPYQPTDAE